MTCHVDQSKITTYRTCRVCAAKLWHRNRTGLCRLHAALDPDLQAARKRKASRGESHGAAIRRALDANPESREAQRRRSAEFNRTEAMRAKSRELAKRITPCQRRKGHGPKIYCKQGRSLSERHLAHVPPDQRRLYLFLTRNKRIPAAEALTLVTSQDEVELERFRRKIMGDGQ